MTLIVARRLNNKVSISSDSRISFPSGTVFDHGVKIFSTTVRIKGLVKSAEDRNKWEFEHEYAVAIMGNTLGAYTIKEKFAGIISRIQYMSNISDISVVGIGQFVYNAFEEISGELSLLFRESGLSELIFAGWCIIHKRVRVLRFYVVVSATGVKYLAEEILLGDGWFFGGSGKGAAEQVHAEHPEFSPGRLLKTVIDGKLDPTVGGPIQIGGFPGENFHLTGISEDVDLGDGKMQKRKKFQGFDLNQPKATRQYPYLFIPSGSINVDHDWPGGDFDYLANSGEADAED